MLWVKSHSDEEVAKALQPQFPDADLDVLTTLVGRYKEQDTWRPNPVLTEEGLNHMMKIMEMAGQLDKRAPYEEIVNTEFAEKALNEVKLEE